MRKNLELVAPGLLYLGVIVLVTWPLVIGGDFIGHSFGDTYEYTRHIWWIKQALQTGQPLYWQPLLGYPDGLSGLWLWANPLQSFPAWLFAFVMPLTAAFNLAILLRLALNGWAMYLLARDLTGRTGPALLAGLIFMLYPAFQGQLAIGHTGLLLLWPVPLLILSLRRLALEGGRRWLLLSAGLFVVSLWGSILLLIYLVGPLIGYLLLRHLLRRNWLALRRLIPALLLGGLVSLLFIGPFLVEESQQPARLDEGGDVTYSADLLGLLTPSPQHPLYAQLDYTGRALGIDPWERLAYVGLIAAGLALVGLWRKREARFWLPLGGVAWLFSLGPLLKVLDSVVTLNLGDYTSNVTLPWLAFANLPLLNIVRTPARFNFTVGLVVAVLAAYGAALLWDRVKAGRSLLFVGLAVLIVLDLQSYWPFPTTPGTVPLKIQALAGRDDIRAVMNLPWDHLLAQKDGMFLQTGHHKPLIAGHVTRRTPVDPAKLTVLQRTLDPALLDREGVDVLILHKQWAAPNDRDRVLALGQPFYEDERILALEVPDPTAPPAFQAVYDRDFAVNDQQASYFFAPEPGWLHLSAQLTSADRDLHLSLDGEMTRQRSDPGPLDLPVFVASAGYHTLTWTVTPACPAHHLELLACRSAEISGLTLTDFQPADLGQPVLFDQGITLAAHIVKSADKTLSVNLWWRFDAAGDENRIRFVHVVDQQGNLAVQRDNSLGQRPAHSAWMETLRFDDLPPGDYTIYTGWYTYPDNLRLAVRSNVADASNNRVRLGTVHVD